MPLHPLLRRHLFSIRLAAAATLSTLLGAGLSGCVSSAECGICDPENLYLTSITGVNYAGNPDVHIVSPTCEGDACPKPRATASFYTEEIIQCEETAEAQGDPFGAEEYCRLSPLVTTGGIQFVFNNLLDGTTVELTRKDPKTPTTRETYQWQPDILHIEGPISRFNGDFYLGEGGRPSRVTRYVNLSCIDNLRLRGEDFQGHEEYEDPRSNRCNSLRPDGRPYKMWDEVEPESGFPAAITYSYRGEWDWRSSAESCTPPADGPDTCCSSCDYELSVNVAKYGVPAGSQDAGREDWLNPHVDEGGPGAALRCNPAGDKFAECRDFTSWVDRSEEYRSFRYAWAEQGEAETFPLPSYDKLRETHPDDRPQWLENRTTRPPCRIDQDCVAPEGHALPGTECVGIDPDTGSACDPEISPACEDGRCLARWFASCSANVDTTGTDGFCVDSRFSDAAARSCYVATEDYPGGDAGSRLAQCDAVTADGDGNGNLSAAECCHEELGNTGTCDPFFQEEVAPVARYDRDAGLPEAARNCVCTESYEDRYPPGSICRTPEMIPRLCFDDDGEYLEERDGEYALSFVARVGGVIHDPSAKGVEWRPAHLGRVPRAYAEACYETRTTLLVSDLNVKDGWRANDPFAPHNYEDFDRALCSGQSYTVVFNTDEDEGSVVTDKVGNTLAGRARYTFETSQFHVIPGSGFPINTLQVGACETFSVRFSNKYDPSPENQIKLEIWRLREDDDEPSGFRRDELVAGGANCAATEAELDEDGTVPCLTVDVRDQWRGIIRVQIDPVEFGGVLQAGEWYRLHIPGLESIEDIDDEDAYYAAFWDVCGMPLIIGDDPEEQSAGYYDFQIDPPQCKEDLDQDNYPLSCDNARDHYNPDQGNLDDDAFGDVIDLCPTVFTTNNRADSDSDGVGNDCDNCRKVATAYNQDAAGLGIPFYMRVRNIPFQDDADGDGIGDVCDNCVVTANCEDYDLDNPWSPGRPIDVDDRTLCQRDDDRNMVGDQCVEFTDPNGPFATDWAVGPIGFGDFDDFDQDGLPNLDDNCPRQPVERVMCTVDDDCPNSRCVGGLCNHDDTDQDGVGDSCDTCPFVSNPEQLIDGAAQEDDGDNDFIGARCEANSRCGIVKDSRPLGFYEVAVNGYCCTTRYPAGQSCGGDADCGPRQICDQGSCALIDPDGVPIRLECSEDEEDAGECRKLPDAVQARPGMTELPTGCEAALDAAGITAEENVRLGGDYQGDLWSKLCLLPQWDQDFDGLGDLCDLCPYSFDPTNAPYRDALGKVWPTSGLYCTAEYSPDNVCELVDGDDGDSGTDDGGDTDDGDGDTGTDTDTGTGTDPV